MHDFLCKAREWRPEEALESLSIERLREIAEVESIDFATAVAFDRVARHERNRALIGWVDADAMRGSTHRSSRPTTLVIVPNLGFGLDRKSKRTVDRLCRIADELGMPSVIAPTHFAADLLSNADEVIKTLLGLRDKPAVIVSMSKGSAEVKIALTGLNGPEAFRSVKSWINVSGLTDGTPVVNLLLEKDLSEILDVLARWYYRLDRGDIVAMVKASRDCGRGIGRTLSHDLQIPRHIRMINVVGFPTRADLGHEHIRVFHELMSSWGPNDGFALLGDLIHQPGECYPIWGADHYLDRAEDLDRVTRALLQYALNENDAPSFSEAQQIGSRTASQDDLRSPGATAEDWERLRHARERTRGFAIGQYLQPPPLLFSRDGHNLFLGDIYRGRAAFLIGGGPSLTSHPLQELDRRGVLTCALNNAATIVRPQLWVCVDSPGNFSDVIWQDPAIWKFVPLCHMERTFLVRDEQDELVPSQQLVGDMPSVFGYRRNETFRPDQWLYEDTFNWGNEGHQVDELGNKGSRSVMYIALRLLHYLGIRRVFLLGCDFRMELGKQNYAFEQDRSASSVRGNNATYAILNSRLESLKPHFDRAGFEVWNCTPESGLTVFPHIPFGEAVEWATEDMPKRINTVGMYDYEKRKRDEAKLKALQSNSATTGGDVPEFSLVVAVDEKCLEKLNQVWPTWMTFKPELRERPLVLIHDESISPRSRACRFLSDHPDVQFRLWSMDDAGDQREKMLTGLVHGVARWVETPWYLKLDVDVVATAHAPLALGEWFVGDEQGPPVFVSNPWGYTKPATAIEKMENWADSVPELATYPRLNLHVDPNSELVRHPRIISWCFFGNTAWTRQMSELCPGRLPCPSQDTFLFYCAARRRDPYRRIRMSDFGWQHVAAGRRRLARRCKEVMEPLVGGVA